MVLYYVQYKDRINRRKRLILLYCILKIMILYLYVQYKDRMDRRKCLINCIVFKKFMTYNKIRCNSAKSVIDPMN